MTGWLGWLSLAIAIAPAAAAQEIDWQSVAHVPVIEVITQDEDGEVRETKVWFVLVESIAYLRTNESRWLANIDRDPGVVLRIEQTEYDQVANRIPGPETLQRVDAASLEKYGVQERFTHFFRMSDPTILRLSPPAAPVAPVAPVGD